MHLEPKSVFQSYLIDPPEVVESVLFVFGLDNFQLLLDGRLPEDGADEEGDEPLEGVEEVAGGNVEVEVGVFGGGVGVGAAQVWSLSSSKVSRQLLRNDLNPVSSVSLLRTASTALANEVLFELTRRPSLTQAFSLSLAETSKETGCG